MPLGRTLVCLRCVAAAVSQQRASGPSSCPVQGLRQAACCVCCQARGSEAGDQRSEGPLPADRRKSACIVMHASAGARARRRGRSRTSCTSTCLPTCAASRRWRRWRASSAAATLPASRRRCSCASRVRQGLGSSPCHGRTGQTCSTAVRSCDLSTATAVPRMAPSGVGPTATALPAQCLCIALWPLCTQQTV